MPAATDPPPPSKPSRYRTIRGKNVPESRRFVEPATATPTVPPNAAPARIPASPSSNSNSTTATTATTASNDSNDSRNLSPRRRTPVAASVPGFHSNDVPQPPPLPASADGLNGLPPSGRWNMNDAVRPTPHAPPAPPVPPPSQLQTQQQQQQQQPSGSTATTAVAATAAPAAAPSRHRPPPLRPTLPGTSSAAAASAPVPVPALSPSLSPSPAPILVPLPSARARGMVPAAEQHELLLAGGGALDADEVARRDAEAERLLAEQKRKDLERLQRELANHQPAVRPKSPSREKFAFLSRRRGLSSAAPPTPTSSSFTTSTEPLPTSPISPGASSSRPTTSYTSSRTHSGSEPPLPSSAPIDPTRTSASTTASAGAAPAATTAALQQMDVPSSAPGSGANKHIVVRCQQFSVTVPISSETTVGDALDVATGLLPRGINLSACVLIESYTRLGLERRLRRYERIKDIMNSWDSDNDNAFLIMLSNSDGAAVGAAESAPKEKKSIFAKSSSSPDDSNSGIANNSSNSVGRNGHASDLDLSSVSRSRSTHPPGFVFMQMYHSQKPGRWSKRFITLVEETGQMVASKKADESRLAFLSSETSNTSGSNNSSGDFQNLCHLSDYDIYTPTDAQMRKHLRPPKTYCFAIKSQQRTNVFLNTENYVHFFSTDDVVQARTFYDRVFAWRSWYLVHRQLALPVRNATTKKKNQEEQLQKQKQAQLVPMPPSSSVSAALKKNVIQRSLSRKSASNTPLVDKARLSMAGSLFGGIGDFDPTLDLDRSEKPGVAETSTVTMRRSGEPNTFVSSGLLGNAYNGLGEAGAGRQQESAMQISSTVTSRDAAAVRDRNQQRQSSGGSFKGTTSAAAAAAAVGNGGGANSDPPWFPSASDHTARQRSKSIRETPSSRPQSEEDIPLGLQFPQLLQQQKAEREASMSRSRSTRRTIAQAPQLMNQQQQQTPPMPPNMPAPLIDLTPKFQEARQWSKDGKGRGVRAPPGTTHLVDLATARMAGGSSSLTSAAPAPPSNANLLRRGDAVPQSYQSYQAAPSIYQGSSGSRRSQTMTSSSVAAATTGFSRSRSLAHHNAPRGGGGGGGGEAPPVPLLARIPGNAMPTHDVALSSRERSTTLTRNQ